MLKSVELIRRKPGLSREEFRRYYEEVHAPLAVKHFGQYYARYVRSYVGHHVRGEEPQFDCITEIWFKDARAAQALVDDLGGSGGSDEYTTELGRVFREDEERFMDRTTLVAFMVREDISALP